MTLPEESSSPNCSETTTDPTPTPTLSSDWELVEALKEIAKTLEGIRLLLSWKG